MNIVTINDGQAATMTSSEISEMVDSRHDSVKRTIETLAKKGVIAFPQSVEKATAGRPAMEYVFAGRQGKRDSLIVVAQLCPEFTAKIVDRWQELESKVVQPAIPQTLPEALRLAAEAIEMNEKLALENKAQAEALAVAAPKVEAFDVMAAGDDSLTVTQAAKVIGVKRDELTHRMHKEGWVYRQNSSWVAYDKHIKSGNLEYKEANYTDEKTGMKCVKPYCHITPKGLARLALMFGKNLQQIPANDPQAKGAA